MTEEVKNNANEEAKNDSGEAKQAETQPKADPKPKKEDKKEQKPKETKAKTLKVRPRSDNIVPVNVGDAHVVLWGVQFNIENDKDGKPEKITAELPKEEAEAMIDAGRVVKA